MIIDFIVLYSKTFIQLYLVAQLYEFHVVLVFIIIIFLEF